MLKTCTFKLNWLYVWSDLFAKYFIYLPSVKWVVKDTMCTCQGRKDLYCFLVSCSHVFTISVFYRAIFAIANVIQWPKKNGVHWRLMLTAIWKISSDIHQSLVSLSGIWSFFLLLSIKVEALGQIDGWICHLYFWGLGVVEIMNFKKKIILHSFQFGHQFIPALCHVFYYVTVQRKANENIFSFFSEWLKNH